MRVPAVLIPFPSATDNHQFLNALAYVESGAAEMVEQSGATPQSVSECVGRILSETERREALRRGLARWHEPAAAETIAHLVLEAISSRYASRKQQPVQTSSSLPAMA
jgi:UDP-N-acetylglucosamine--N-acetylmuramyl-(pentapeptide) pyrophosphoryl-undecaprenol N-acetylglucosamine transferase